MSTALLNRTQVRGEFARVYAADPFASVVSRIALETTSKGASERYAMALNAPEATKWKGARNTAALEAVYQDVANEKWESSIVVRNDDLRRDQTGTVRRKMADLARQLSIIKWKLLLDVIAANPTAYDGKALLATNHSLRNSGTQKNILTSSEVAALNVSDANAPTPEEAVDALMGVIAYMQDYRNENGTPMMEMAKSFIVLAPFNLRAPLKTAVTANNLASGETNVIRALVGELDLTIIPAGRLYTPATPSADFYVINADEGSDPAFIIQEETPVELEFLGEGSDFTFNNDAQKVGGKWNGGAGPGEPLKIAKCTFN